MNEPVKAAMPPVAPKGPECPVCACAIEGSPRLCPRCETPHHDDCWEYAGGCAIYGCDSERWTRTDLATFEDVSHRILTWSKLFQAQWWSFAAAALGILVIVTLMTIHLALLEPLGLILGSTTKVILGGIVISSFFGSAISSVVYVSLLGPVWYQRRKVQTQTGIRLIPPSRRAKSLVDSVAKQPVGRFLRQMVLGFGSALTGLVLVGTPLRASFLGISVFNSLAIFLILAVPPGLFLWGIARATGRRLAFLESVRNRLLTSFQKSEKP